MFFLERLDVILGHHRVSATSTTPKDDIHIFGSIHLLYNRQHGRVRVMEKVENTHIHCLATH